MSIDRITDLLPPELVKYAWIALIALVGLVLVGLLWKISRWRKRSPQTQSPELILDIESLPEKTVPPGAPMLEFYNIPMRLTAIIIAPAGRASELPPSQLTEAYESILPGLASVVASHQPLLRRWPPQLSPRGFAHSFFANVRLPGTAGKGTRWCSVAGMFKFSGRSAMVGLLMQSASNNSLSQVIVEHEGKWLDVLRVKSPSG